MCIQIALGHIFVTEHLEEDVRMHILALLGNNHLGNDLGGRRDKADTHTCREDLGKRRAVDHHTVGIHRLDGGDILTAEAQLAVGVILQNDHAVLTAQLVHALSARKQRGDAHGVLECRNNIQQLDIRRGFELFLEHIGENTLSVAGNADGLCTVGAESVQRTDKAGVLAENDIALIAECFAGKLNALLTARHDDRIVKVASNVEFLGQTRFNCVSQRRVSLGDAVLQRRGRLICKNVCGKPTQLLDRERLGRGATAAERDDRRIGEVFKDLTDRGRL